MRITINIPDGLYRLLSAKAAREKRSIEALILRSAAAILRPPQSNEGRRDTFPIIRSKRPGSLRIDNEKINEIISFP
jgi:plasmid stability protein